MGKLTLSMGDGDIQDAKELAAAGGTSLSAMFTRYIRALVKSRKAPKDLPPVTKRLSGIVSLPSNKTDRELIEEAIEERHGRGR